MTPANSPPRTIRWTFMAADFSTAERAGASNRRGSDARSLRRPWLADERHRAQCLEPWISRARAAHACAAGGAFHLRALVRGRDVRDRQPAPADHPRFRRLSTRIVRDAVSRARRSGAG